MENYQERVDTREPITDEAIRIYTYENGDKITIKKPLYISAHSGHHIVWDAFGMEHWVPSHWIRIETIGQSRLPLVKQIKSFWKDRTFWVIVIIVVTVVVVMFKQLLNL